jgi:hypothetical protein
MARQAGRLVNDFRRFRDSVNAEVREALGDPGALSNLQNLSSLSNLPARGRAWVTSVAAGSTSSTSPPSGTPPSGTPPSGTPPSGIPPATAPPPASGVSPGPPQHGGTPDDGSRGSDGGGFDPRFN